MSESGMLRPALIGGVLLGVLSSLPLVSAFNCVCCAWVIGGGVLAAYLYVKDSSVPVTLGRGVVLGLFTGLVGTLVNVLFMIPLYFLMNRAGTGVMETIRGALDRVPNLPPEAEAALRGISDKGSLGVFFLITLLVFTLVTFCFAAMLGGAIGVAIFEKRKLGPPPQPPVHVPPPTPDW